MQILNTQNYNTYSNPYFTGTVKSTYLYDKFAKTYARTIKVGDSDWPKLGMYINTIRAIKNDGTNNEFILDTIGLDFGIKNLFIKYGNYTKQDEVFKSSEFASVSGQEELAKEVFNRIVQFGKEYFGLAEVSKPISEFAPAKLHLRRANDFNSRVKTAKDSDTSKKLMIKASREIAKAEEAVSALKSEVINNL